MNAPADTTLLLEGTYPFVRGGVSSWVHQIISGLPDVTFDLVFVGGRRADYGEQRYELPKNVRNLQIHYLEDALKGLLPKRRTIPESRVAQLRAFHDRLREASQQHMGLPEPEVGKMLEKMSCPGGLQLDDFMYANEAFEFIRERHMAGDPDSAFLDYFWTLRLMHAPLFLLAKIAEQVPESRSFHAVSTGYAGFLGAILARRRRRPLILTEHGIYTKERRIDLNKADWLETLRPAEDTVETDPGSSLRALWVRFFESLGRMAYQTADPIISLYGGNQERQIADGAARERTEVIVNGIDVDRFRTALAQRKETTPKVVALIGRVVPIKDVKSFIRTIQNVQLELPEAEGWIVGGEDEDPSYAKECHDLVASLGLEGRVKFLGHQNVVEILPQLGVLMLTSISEAQPLSVLEAFAAGVPCVTTDVGACREQIEGRDVDDQQLGVAGKVVSFANPDELAQAVLWLLRDEQTYKSCQQAALTRVNRYYSQGAMLEAYERVYMKAKVA